MTLATWGLAVLLAAPAPAADRDKPPVLGPPRPLRLPPVQRLVLGNGLPVILTEQHEVPVAEVRLVLRSGAAADPLERTGLASLTAAMLDEGAAGRDPLAIADALDYLGATLEAEAGWDQTTVRLHVPVVRLADALPILADVALRPDFEAKELERVRKESLTGLLQERDEPTAVASMALARAVFGTSHRYGLRMAGEGPSLAALSAEDLRAFHHRHYQPGNAALVVVGDVTRDILPLVEQAFGPWPAGGAPTPPPPAPAQVRGRRVVLVDKPGAPQSVLRVGRVGPPRQTPDFPAIEVMNTLLGGSFTSRLNSNLREQHGYSYGAASRFSYRRSAGLFFAAASVQTRSTGPALSEMMKELRQIRVPPSANEVERARNYLALSYASEFETTAQLAEKLARRFVYDLPDDVDTAFAAKALAVAAPDMARAARTHVDPESCVIVIVGDRKVIEAPVATLKLGPTSVMRLDEAMGPAPQVQ